MRSWLAYKFLRWAVWLDTEQTVALSAAMVAENARRTLDAQGLYVVRGEDGLPSLQPIEEQAKDPTVHQEEQMSKKPKWVRVGMLVSVSPEVVEKERYSYASAGSYRDAEHIVGYIWRVADRRKTPRNAVGVNWDHNWDPDLILCKSLATGGYHYWWGEEIEQLKEEARA